MGCRRHLDKALFSNLMDILSFLDAANIKSIDKSVPVIQATNLKRPAQRHTPVRDYEEPSAEGEDDEDENGQPDLSDEDMPCMSLPAPVPGMASNSYYFFCFLSH